MYNKVECVILSCDNCSETYTDDHTGFSIFGDENAAHDHADNDGWYLGHLDGEHEGKHYCPSCFKYDDIEDDVIHVDANLKNPQTPDQ